jgi:hypothetical protein
MSFLNYTDLSLCQSRIDFSGMNVIEPTIPTEIGLLTQLQYLLLVSQNLSGTIPSSIWNLKQLKYLDLSLNHDLVGTIPTEFGNLVQ